MSLNTPRDCREIGHTISPAARLHNPGEGGGSGDPCNDDLALVYKVAAAAIRSNAAEM
jgi:hypothetical protein